MRTPFSQRETTLSWQHVLITLAVLGSTLWLGLEKILASEAAASIFTAALGYVYTATVQERQTRANQQAIEAARANGPTTVAAKSAEAAAVRAEEAATRAEETSAPPS